MESWDGGEPSQKTKLPLKVSSWETILMSQPYTKQIILSYC